MCIRDSCDPATHVCVACVGDGDCAPGTRCMGNRCVAGCTATSRCPTGQTCCGGGCVDTATNTDHCGACGASCAPANAVGACAAGRCTVASCVAPRGDCDGDVANGCEVDLTSDAQHCAVCGAAVRLPNATGACVASRPAVGRCDEGFADCDGRATNGCETAIAANNAACGACGRSCGRGERCEAGACVADCRRSGTVPCATGESCDYTDGVCRADGSRCLLTGEWQTCGAASCGPGSVCDPRAMRCVPALSCRSTRCETETGRCWGVDCPCTRPTAACTTLAPAAIPTAFLSGAFGFDIDDACNLYTATMLSGPDYVRRVDPAGRVTTWASIANLNMGEVAVQRLLNVGAGDVAANVAFTYICCASCGCASSPPQGVGHVQSDGALPVVVPATVTSGTGPFGANYLDTGPYGLSVSSIGEFFVGNVRTNGDWFRYDTDTRAITAVAELPARITASCAYDLDTMLVAVVGGDLYTVDRAPGGSVRRIGNLGTDVQSVKRDTFTGRFYAALRDNRVVSFLPDATGVTTETMNARGARVAVSPDGWLYVLLREGGPVSRIALPSAR